MLNGSATFLIRSLFGVILVRYQTLHHIAIVIRIAQYMGATLFHGCATIGHYDRIKLVVASFVNREFDYGIL